MSLLESMMSSLRSLAGGLGSLFRKEHVEEELDEELNGFLEMAAEEKMKQGVSRKDALRAVRLERGSLEVTKEEVRSAGWESFVETCWQDLRFAARTLRKAPGFTLVAVLTLALGIGANTALFSVVNAVLLDPLPYPDPDQLVTLHMTKPNFETGAIPFPTFRDWQAQNRTFSAMALSRNNSINLIGAGETEYLLMNYVTSDFFSILGIQPVKGRNFAPGEDDLGGPPLVQISEGLWKRKFAGAPDIIGTSLNLSGKVYTIIGVIPASFDLRVSNFFPTDIYLPLGQFGTPALKSRRAALGLHGIGRLKPGVALEQARADMETVSRNLADAYPDSNRGTKANLIPLQHSMTSKVQPVLLLLLGAVGFVLLIACVNVASLLLARSQVRAHELGIRAALGASRTRMLRQLLTESVLLALAGGSLGVLLAAFGTRAALALLSVDLPRMGGTRLDLNVLFFSLAISTLAGVAFGLAPALRLARSQLQPQLQATGRRVTAERHRTQRVLVVMEISTALVLLIGTGLMARSLARLWRVDPGFDTHNLLSFGLSLSPRMDSATPAAVRAAWRDLRDTLAATPGVESLSLREGASPMRTEDDMVFWLDGQPRPRSDSDMNWTLRYGVQPDYLRVTKVPLRRGRFFSAQDNEKSPVVVVVDDAFAATFFPGQEALGRRIRWGDGPREAAEIVGIVGHVKQWGLDNDDTTLLRAQMYQDFDQLGDEQLSINAGIIARTSGPPLGPLPSLKERIQQLNSENVMYGAITMEQTVAETLSTRQFSMLLLGSFACLALLLATIGIYGVIAYLVGHRTHEFGIRMALGAQRRDVLGLVMREGGRMALLGVAVGTLAALGLTRLMKNLLFGVKPTDPVTFATVATIFILVALAACYIPARRAAKVDPMVALRYE